MAAPRRHRWSIDALEYERHEQRRGRRFAYEAVDPRRTALVVVDMIPFFVDQNLYCRGVVPNINRLAGAVRVAGGQVAWVVPALRQGPAPGRSSSTVAMSLLAT